MNSPQNQKDKRKSSIIAISFVLLIVLGFCMRFIIDKKQEDANLVEYTELPSLNSNTQPSEDQPKEVEPEPKKAAAQDPNPPESKVVEENTQTEEHQETEVVEQESVVSTVSDEAIFSADQQRSSAHNSRSNNENNSDDSDIGKDIITKPAPLGNRERESACDELRSQNIKFPEMGKVVIDIEVDDTGKVVKATVNTNRTEIVDKRIKQLAVECASAYRYEASTKTKSFPKLSKGVITIDFANF